MSKSKALGIALGAVAIIGGVASTLLVWLGMAVCVYGYYSRQEGFFLAGAVWLGSIVAAEVAQFVLQMIPRHNHGRAMYVLGAFSSGTTALLCAFILSMLLSTPAELREPATYYWVLLVWSALVGAYSLPMTVLHALMLWTSTRRTKDVSDGDKTV